MVGENHTPFGGRDYLDFITANKKYFKKLEEDFGLNFSKEEICYICFGKNMTVVYNCDCGRNYCEECVLKEVREKGECKCKCGEILL